MQGNGIIEDISSYLENEGKHALVIADSIVWDIAGGKVVNLLEYYNIPTQNVVFNGETSEKELKRISDIVKNEKVNLVISLGGGKTLDTSKTVSEI